MAATFVVGLFQSKGIAEDACNRLKTEGMPSRNVALQVLHELAPTPDVVTPELAALAIDPIVFGDVRKTYAPFVRNGETAVFVRTHDESEIDLAVDTIRQYAPLNIRVATSTADGGVRNHDVLWRHC